MIDWADEIAERVKGSPTDIAIALRTEHQRCLDALRATADHWRSTPSAVVALRDAEKAMRR